jgi:hypothetical protein
MRQTTGKIGTLLVVAAAIVLLAVPARAVPDLQVYIDGATYDTGSETWVTTDSSFDLWIIAANYAMQDVKFSAALPNGVDPASGSISVQWKESGITLAGNLLSGTPSTSEGHALTHDGLFPSNYYEFFAGDFGLGETVENKQPVEEWEPGETGTADGEVKKFLVTVAGYEWVHFDAYDHYYKNDEVHAKFAPFSHDAEGGGAPVPEPATLLLVGAGLLGMGARRLKARKATKLGG